MNNAEVAILSFSAGLFVHPYLVRFIGFIFNDVCKTRQPKELIWN